MKTSFAILIILLSHTGYCQFIDSRTPIEMTESPRFNSKSDLEITVRWNRSNDSTFQSTVKDYEFRMAKAYIYTGEKSEKVEVNPTGIEDKRVYNVDKKFFEKNWDYVDYIVFYKYKDKKDSTKTHRYYNSNSKKDYKFKNEVKIVDFYKYDNDNGNAYLVVKANNDFIRYTDCFVKDNRGNVSKVASAKNSYGFYRGVDYILKMTALPGASFNNGSTYYIELNTHRNQELYEKVEVDKAVVVRSPFLIKQLSGNSMLGNKDSVITIDTSIPAKSVTLNFIDNPLSLGNLPAIVGKSVNNDASKWEFPVPNKKIQFGKYRIEFRGESLAYNKEPLRKSQYTFEKRNAKISSLRVTQDKDGFKVTCVLNEDYQGMVIDLLVNSGVLGPMRMDSIKVYSKVFKQSELLNNKLISKDQNEVRFNVSIDGVLNETSFVFPVNKISEQELANIGSKKKDIKEYLVNNNVKGDIDKIADTIVEELRKDKDKRNWSTTWSSVATFLKPLAGVLMLLI